MKHLVIYLIFFFKHVLSDSPILLIDSNLAIAFKNLTIVANQEPNNSFLIYNSPFDLF